jgi:hypothetical protein
MSEYDDFLENAIQCNRSPALAEFEWHWFQNTWALTRGEVDLSFLDQLTPSELEYARARLRAVLHLAYTHIIEGVAALRDVSSVPTLRSMLEHETNLSRKLTIAGALWKLARDESFVDCIVEMKSGHSAITKQAHFHQIMWLDDERAIDIYFELLRDPDSLVRFLALKTLNELEFDQRFMVPAKLFPCSGSDYESRREDKVLRELLATNLRNQNDSVRGYTGTLR